MKKDLIRLPAFLLAVVMLLSLAACGKDETAELLGKYNCIAVAQDGTNFTAPESENAYIELKKAAKARFRMSLPLS